MIGKDEIPLITKYHMNSIWALKDSSIKIAGEFPLKFIIPVKNLSDHYLASIQNRVLKFKRLILKWRAGGKQYNV